MDLLAADLSCPCVEGHAQRDYPALVKFLEADLERRVKLVFAEELGIAGEKLGTIWKHEEDAFDSHASIIAGNDRVLVLTTYGDLMLLDASADRFQPVSRLKPFGDAETWSQPALAPGRLYVRTQNEIVCLGF